MWGCTRKFGLFVIAALVLLLLSSGWAAGPSKKKKVIQKIDLTKLVWPQPPDAVRIRYLAQFTGEMDLLGRQQAKGGLLERLAGVSISPEERMRMMLSKPYGVAADSKGRLYVADSAQLAVFCFRHGYPQV